MEEKTKKELKIPDLTKALRNAASVLGIRKADKDHDLKTHDGLARMMEELDDHLGSSRASYEKRWLYNAAHIIGKHNVEYDVAGRALIPAKTPSWRKRMVINYIAPAEQRKIAKLIRLRPKPEAIPKSTDGADEQGAKLAEKICEAKSEEYGFDVLAQELILKSDVFSVAYLKVFWNKDIGQQYEDTEDTVDGQQVTKRYYEGDVDFCVEDPFTLALEPKCRSLKEASWCLSSKTKTLGWALDNFPDHTQQLVEKRRNSEKKASIMSRFMSLFKGQEDSILEENVVYREFWQKPKPYDKSGDKWVKSGLYICMIDNIIIKIEEFPYDHGQLPYVEFYDGWLHGLSDDPFGPTQTAQLIPINRDINSTRSRMSENIAMCARPKILVPRGIGIDNDALTGEPGEKVEYDPIDGNHLPTAMKMPVVNDRALYEQVNMDMADFENISGQHEVSRGTSPPGVTAGVAIEALQQADDTMLRPQADCFRRGMTNVYWMLLELCKQYYDDERETVLYKEGGRGEILRFSGSDISFQSIRIEPNSMKPTSPLALRDQIIKMAQYKLFGPYESKEHQEACYMVLRMLQWGDMAEAFNQVNRDKIRAEWENKILDAVEAAVPEPDATAPGGMKKGPVVDHPEWEGVPNPFDNHEDHIKFHRERMKELSFNRLSDEAKLAYIYHVNEHEMAIRASVAAPGQMDSELMQAGLVQPTTPQQAAAANPAMLMQMVQGGMPPAGPAAPPAPGPGQPQGGPSGPPPQLQAPV